MSATTCSPAPAHIADLHAAELTENPFASTHSLDKNPFDDPDSVPTTSHTSFPDHEHAARMEELARREQELEARERELTQKADHIRRFGRNNWPRCTCAANITLHGSNDESSVAVYPLIFHSIQDEIPQPSQPLVNRLYQLWLVLAATLLLNMVACILILVAGSSNGGSDLGSSIGYVSLLQA